MLVRVIQFQVINFHRNYACTCNETVLNELVKNRAPFNLCTNTNEGQMYVLLE